MSLAALFVLVLNGAKMRSATTLSRLASRASSRAPEREVDLLIVEDDQVIREQLAEAFTDEGFTVATAENGERALQVLDHTPARLVITDLVMPVMNGWELAGHLASDPGWGQMPVLFLTAIGNAHRLPRGPVFLKPIDVDSLIRAVKTHLGCADA
jgi:CheY-like chemotaxis protein